MRTLRVVATAVAGLALLAGCGAPSTPVRTGVAAGQTLPALRMKLAALALDDCATHPAPDQVAGCAKFVRELQNVVPAARAEAAAVPSAAALSRAADAVDGAVGRYARHSCETGGTPDCAGDLTALQDGFRQLVAAVGS